MSYIKYEDHITSEYWKEVSKEVKRRAGYRCQVCNSGLDLTAHHRTYEVLGREMESLGDITCLCVRCHALFHGKTDRQQAVSTPPKKHKAPVAKESSDYYDHKGDLPSGDLILMTPAMWRRLHTKRGGMTNATIAALGVEFPLKHGWGRKLMGKHFTRGQIHAALYGRSIRASKND